MVNISLFSTSIFSYVFFLFSGSGYTIQIVVSSCKISAPVFAYLSVIRLLIILLVFFSSFRCKWQVVQSFFFSIVGCCFVVVAIYWIWCREKSVSNTKKSSIITEWSINVRHNLHRLKNSPKRVKWKREIMFHHHQHVTYIMSAAIYEITNYFFLTI